MDFFSYQDAARKKTGVLILYFAAAVALIILAVYAALAAIGVFGFGLDPETGRAVVWNPELFLWVAGGTLALIVAGSIYKILVLSRGGASVAEALGGRLLESAPDDLHEQQLLNVVEEMAIASGCAVPQIYVLDQEAGINAFAAGLTPGDAVIGVTRGAMTLLSRDELQGVMAHEFGHILNGDTRLNLRLIGLLHGILMIALVGRALLGSRTRGHRSFRVQSSRNGDGRLALVGIALLAIGGIGVFFGRLIKSALSRQREFLADASAVQFTRNPSGLAGALKRIGGLASGSLVDSSQAEEASHMFFGNALRSSFAGWMSTHPPLAVRIKRIDPRFDGEFPPVSPQDITAVTLVAADARKQPAVSGLVGRLDPATVVGGMGQATPATLSYAERLLSALPAPLTAAAHNSRGACALVYGLLLNPDKEVRQQQVSTLDSTAAPEVLAEFRKVLPHLEHLDDRERLPLLDLTFPALRRLAPAQYRELRDSTRALIRADCQTDLFEYALERALDRHLEPRFSRKPKRGTRTSPERVFHQLALVLSALAHQATSDQDHALRVFERGLQAIEPPRPALSLRSREDCTTSALDEALHVLAGTPPFVKKSALEACAACVLADENVTVREFELLRAIADSLDCPIPPMVDQVTRQ